MESNRVGISESPKVIPRIRLDNDTFDFAKKLNVGDKGDMRFSGIVMAHSAKESDDDDETKVIKFTNIDLTSNRNARLI